MCCAVYVVRQVHLYSLSNSYSSGRVEGNHQVAPVTIGLTCRSTVLSRQHDSVGLEVTAVFTREIFNMADWSSDGNVAYTVPLLSRIVHTLQKS